MHKHQHAQFFTLRPEWVESRVRQFLAGNAAANPDAGNPNEAKLIANILLKSQPRFTISAVVAGKITTPERLTKLARALREAGLPE